MRSPRLEQGAVDVDDQRGPHASEPRHGRGAPVDDGGRAAGGSQRPAESGGAGVEEGGEELLSCRRHHLLRHGSALCVLLVLGSW
ncbi:hypothetical protein GQ55_9G259600 [Panicum hallii var. hallii]|uniref:Uncharacterized protein n=1 Tax=Panicum hallii var. hallii TaxID=1504633 RepID=A0A2T7C730_9POAL|nr:hypothetical protein GQ55_9G259600 [Panicum hallii var. hallii]